MLYEVTSSIVSNARPAPDRCANGGVFSLRECPPMGRGNFILLRRDPQGGSSLLAMGRLQDDCDTLNLAHIRRLGAELGANEVHLFPAQG